MRIDDFPSQPADDFDVRDAYPTLDRTLGEGWKDPKMDGYDCYEELKS